MNRKIKPSLLFFSLLLLNCGDLERDNPTDPGSEFYNPDLILSSSDKGKSSSSESYNGFVSSSSKPSSSSKSSSSFKSTSCPAYNSSAHFCDERDWQVYKIARIGTQIWMAQNLNYNASGSICNGNLDSNCEMYGKLYTWATAKNSCPVGWHLPSKVEWNTLVDFAGGYSTAGTKLKARSDWKENSAGTDNYEFSALPGGYRGSDGNFGSVGYHGYWWTSTEYNSTSAYAYGMHYNDNLDVDAYSKSGYQSIRCLSDTKNEFISSSSSVLSSASRSSSSLASSSSSRIVSSSSSISYEDTRCKDGQDRVYFCEWGTGSYPSENPGCFAIDPTYSDPPGISCYSLIVECNRYGYLYVSSTTEGKGSRCNGTRVSVPSSSSAVVSSSSSKPSSSSSSSSSSSEDEDSSSSSEQSSSSSEEG